MTTDHLKLHKIACTQKYGSAFLLLLRLCGLFLLYVQNQKQFYSFESSICAATLAQSPGEYDSTAGLHTLYSI